MGRRNLHSREQQQEMAIAAAELLLIRDGLAGLTMRRVAEVMGYTVGNLYLLFANQDVLLLAVNERTGDAIHSALRAAADAVRESSEKLGVERPLLLGVTVLTSFDDEAWSATGGQLPIADQVIRLAKLAKESGLDGVVASPLEAKLIREACGPDFLIVTPGIRPSFAATNDQKRISTPASALQDGASRLVVGRPITQAEQPQEAVRLIIEEMETVSK